MASQCETTEITRFPELKDRVVEVVNNMLRKCVGPTQSMINRCSTPTLTRTLNTILMHHIRDCLPDIKNRINSMMVDVQRELVALGKEPAAGKSNAAPHRLFVSAPADSLMKEA